MDPITLIGLAASVVQLIDASKKVIGLIKTFKDGDRDLSSLAQDIFAFTEALIGFDRILRSKYTLHRISGPTIENLLNHAQELVQELETRLIQIGSSNLSAVRRAKWVQHKSSVTKLHEKIKEKNVMLHTFISISHAETFLSLTSQCPDLMLPQPSHDVAEPTPTGDDRVAEPLSNSLQVPTTAMRPRRSSNSSYVTSTSTSGVSSMVDRLSLYSSANSIASSASSMSVVHGDTGLNISEPEKQDLAMTDVTHQSKRQAYFQE
ncbi:unnamed protein product, partial [Clonostachys rosea f. rosea IK726]